MDSVQWTMFIECCSMNTAKWTPFIDMATIRVQTRIRNKLFVVQFRTSNLLVLAELCKYREQIADWKRNAITHQWIAVAAVSANYCRCLGRKRERWSLSFGYSPDSSECCSQLTAHLDVCEKGRKVRCWCEMEDNKKLMIKKGIFVSAGESKWMR